MAATQMNLNTFWKFLPSKSFSFDFYNKVVFYLHSVSPMLCCLLKKACKLIKPGLTDLSRSMKDKWEIDRRLIELKEKLGAGNFGEVWKGELKWWKILER